MCHDDALYKFTFYLLLLTCSGQAAARVPRQLRRGGEYVLLQPMCLRLLALAAVERIPSLSELAGAPVAGDNGRIIYLFIIESYRKYANNAGT